MPQDIPLEASETLSFTPDSLAHLDSPPVFVLRTPTWREKDFRLRMMRENGVNSHTDEAVRAEVMAGLKAQWSEEDFDTYSAHITNFWDAQDNFAQQKKDDPDLVWDFDPVMEAACRALLAKLEKTWPPLAIMAADIEQYHRLEPVFYVALTVKNWTGLDVKRSLDRGYLTIDTAIALRDALWELDGNTGKAWRDLYIATLGRFYLPEEEAKNSESLSQSETTPAASNETTTSAPAGKSPASKKSSSKIPSAD